MTRSDGENRMQREPVATRARRGARGGPRSWRRRVAAAAALAALAALLPLTAQAQTVTSLVSNTGEFHTGGGSGIYAQSFTTGANSDGYTLSEIQLYITRIDTGDTTTVTLRANTVTGTSNVPGDEVAALTNPASLTLNALNSFTAPPGTTLGPDTTYWVTVNENTASANRLSFSVTSRDGQSGESGFTIGNDRLWKDKAGDAWSTGSDALRIDVRGTVGAGTPPPAGNATGTVSISGTATVGETLTASVSNVMDPEGVTNATYSYQWGRVDADGTSNAVDISGATSSTYTLTADDLGKKVKLRVSFNDDGGNAEQLTSDAHPTTGTVAGITLVSNMGRHAASGSSTINAQSFTTGSNSAGYTLSEIRVRLAAIAAGTGDTTTVTLRDDSSGAPGDEVATLANPASFTLDVLNSFAAPPGTTLEPDTDYWVTVNEGLDGNSGLTFSRTTGDGQTGELGWSIANDRLSKTNQRDNWGTRSATLIIDVRGTVRPVVPNASGTVSITGTATVGETLTAAVSNVMDPEGVTNATYSYQWVRVDADGTSNAVDIPGATSSTYTLTADDLGKKVKLRVSFNDDDGNAEQLTSDAHPTTGTVAGITLVSNTGEFRSGGGNQISAQSFTTGANSAGYTLSEIQLYVLRFTAGDMASVLLRANTVSATSNEPGDEVATLVNPASLTLGALNSFTAPPGTTLEPDTTYWVTVNENASPKISYGSTSSDGQSGEPGFTVGDDSRRKSNDPEAWSTDAAILIIDVRGAAVGGTPPPAPNATGTVSISGTATVGETLTAAVSNVMDPEGVTSPTYSYQWVRVDADGTSNAVDISGATSNTYTLTADDLGKKVKARVSFNDDDGNAEQLTSDAYPATRAVVAGEATLVENVAEPLVTAFSSRQRAQAFTTGNNPNGYALSTIQVWADPAANRTTVVKLRANTTEPNRYRPGAEIATFTNPDAVTTLSSPIFTAPQIITLRPRTTYWVTLGEGLDSADRMQLREVSGTGETGESGWSIFNSSFAKDSDGTSWNSPSSTDRLLRMRLRGIALPPNTPATGTVSISGTATVGETMTASVSGVIDPDGLTSATYSYRWVRVDADGTSNTVDITGATSTTYTSTTTDTGKKLNVRVSFSDDHGYPEELASDAYPATGTVAARPAGNATGTVSITGTAKVGETLTGSVSAVRDPEGATSPTYRYQWVRVDADGTSNAVDIPGAASSAYTPTIDDLGKRVRLRVYFSDDGGNLEQLTSAAYPTSGTVNAGVPEAPAELTATAVGNRRILLSWAEPANNRGADITGYRIEWSADGSTGWQDLVPDTNTAAMVYSDTSAPEGTARHYRVSAINSGGTGAASSVADATASAVAALVLNLGAPSEGGVNRIFAQRFSTGSNPAGYMLSTVVLRVQAVGGRTAAVRIREDLSDRPGDEVATLTNPDRFSNHQSAVFTAPANTRLEPSTRYWVTVHEGLASGDRVQYLITRSGAESGLPNWSISDHSFSKPNNDADSWVRNRLPGTNNVPLMMRLSGVALPVRNATGTVSVTGTAGVGEELTATVSGVTDPDGATNAAYRYQWVRVNTDGTSNPVDISGATSATYTLTANDAGNRFVVRVGFNDDLGNPEKLTSDAYPAAGIVASVVPGAPGDLTANAIGAQRILLSWTEPEGNGGADITGYRIEWSPDGTTGWQDLVPDTNTAATTYIDTPASAGTTRHYRVSAINSVGTSAASNVADATAAAVGALVSNLGESTAGNTNAIAAQTFRTGDNATGYTLTEVALIPRNVGGARTTVVQIRRRTSEFPLFSFVAALTNPTSFTNGEEAIFTAPPGTTLDPNTEYWVATNETLQANERINFEWVTSPAQTGAPGWSIRDQRIERTTPSGTNFTAGSAPLKIAVRGVALPVLNAMGTVSVTGTAGVGEELTATVSGVADPDGLTNAANRYQWVRVDADGTSNAVDISGATSATYTVTADDIGKRVRVRVSFSDDLGNPEELTSDAVPSDAVPSDAVAPGAPGTLTATAVGAQRIDLSWMEPPDNGGAQITGYRIEWSADGTTGWQDLEDNTASTAVTYSDVGLDPQTTRHYRVSAINSEETGSPSNVATTSTNQRALIGITQSTETQIERGARITVCVAADPSRPPTIPVGLRWATEDGTATGDVDYTVSSRTFQLSADNTVNCGEIPVLDDDEIEIVETFFVNLTADDPGEVEIGAGRLSVEIFDGDDDRATVELHGPSTAGEGDRAMFEVSLVPTTPFAVRVLYETVAGTATAGTDYTTTSGTLTFPATSTFDPAGTRQSFEVPILDDTTADPGETFEIRLSLASGQQHPRIFDLPSSAHTVTIDDGQPSVPGAPGDLTATAAATTGGVLSIDLSWMEPTDNGGAQITGYRIEWSADGTTDWQDLVADTADTATAYSDTGGSDTGLAPETTRHYRVSAINSQGTGTASGVATDTTYELIVAGFEFTEYQTSEAIGFVVTCAVVISEPGGAPWPFTLDWSTGELSALAGSDYTSGSASLVFQTNDLSVCARTILLADETLEADEIFLVEMSVMDAGQGLSLRPAVAEVTITDSTTVDIALDGPSTAGEGSRARFEVFLVPATTVQVRVEYTTAAGTATAGTDYTTTSATLTFEPGDDRESFEVPILADATADPGETFEIRLSLPSDQDFADRIVVPATAWTVTIDDEAPPQGSDVDIPDSNLLAALNAALGQSADAAITPAQMAGLTTLDASERGISDISGLEGATGLTTLDLSFNEITGSVDLSALTALTSLDIHNTNTVRVYNINTGRLRFEYYRGMRSIILPAAPRLTSVDAHGNRLTSITIPSLPNLTELILDRNRLTSITLPSLPQLTNLVLRANDLTSISGLSAANLPQLTHLDLSQNEFTSITIPSLPQLAELNLFFNPGLSSFTIPSLPELTKLKVSGHITYTSSDGLRQLVGLTATNLPKIEEIDLRWTRLGTVTFDSDTLRVLQQSPRLPR